MEQIYYFLDPIQYADTFESNLNKDEFSKEFWSKQLAILIEKFAKQAHESYKNDENCQQKIERFKSEYKKNVNQLMNDNDNFLSVRMLLELNEQLLQKNGFKDAWRLQKKIENYKALELLEMRLKELDKLEVEGDQINRSKWLELFRGVLAGNIFDSGATAVQELIENNRSFGIDDALSSIQERPWLLDNFDDFIERLENGPAHNCIAFFCDNSGSDLVLGVLPFIREILKRNTKVILCANSGPSLNDITYNELVEIVKEAGKICSLLDDCYKSERLIVHETGQNGCCLNFLTVASSLFDTMIQNSVDLIVIEGMGRSLHTNLNARFKCETLKLAVIKNKFLASRLNGNLFDAICKYERNS